MKRSFAIILILALSVQLSSAKVIPVEKARQRAASFFSAAEVATRSVSPGEFKLLGTFPDFKTRSADEAPAMYIFERETGGYAIVSADDVARPVLAYSLNASFPSWDEIPENMMGMLQWYADIIGFARSKGWAPFPETRANSDLDPENTVQLKTIHWAQDSPFNNLVKEVEGEKPRIGYIPASIATIMKYHEWPKQGTGTLPSYDYTYNDKQYHIEGITLGHTYKWDLMDYDPDWFNNTLDPDPIPPEKVAQLERLCYDVAVMCQAKFTPFGSSSIYNSALKLTQYFDYDKSMVFLNRERYLAEEWEGFVKRDINEGLPVLFKSFVIDGYNGRYFSCNFAGGRTIMHNHGHDLNSEWRSFFILTPIDGHEEDLIIYYSDQFATFHIMPNQGKSASTDDISVHFGLLTIPHDYHKGMSFTLRSYFLNNSASETLREIRFVLFNKDGIVKEVISNKGDITYYPDINDYLFSANCKISVPIDEGDRICLASLGDDSKTWNPLPCYSYEQIVFTKHPLSELLEIGYDKDFEITDSYLNSLFNRDLPLFFKLYKDLCWTLSRKTDNNIIISNVTFLGNFGGQDYSYYGNMIDNSDVNNHMAIIRLGLPSGAYKLHVHNPATGETMDIDLEI